MKSQKHEIKRREEKKLILKIGGYDSEAYKIHKEAIKRRVLRNETAAKARAKIREELKNKGKENA